MSQAHYRVAVDVGGTFMDFVLLDERTGTVRVEKTPSIPGELPQQFMAGLLAFDVGIGEIARIFHGMTVGVNALIQEKGAKVGLITTKGFRDVLEIGRGGRKCVYTASAANEGKVCRPVAGPWCAATLCASLCAAHE